MKPMSLNSKTYVITPSDSSRSKNVSADVTEGSNVLLQNFTDQDVFCTATTGAGTAVFPTTSTTRNGQTIRAGESMTFEWPSKDDTHLNCIQATAGSGDLHITISKDKGI